MATSKRFVGVPHAGLRLSLIGLLALIAAGAIIGIWCVNATAVSARPEVASTPAAGHLVQEVPTIPPGTTISGVVFNDLNGNGLQDPGETGIAGVSVTILVYGEPTPIFPILLTTDTTGFYQCKGISLQGVYLLRVTETDPVGYVSTTPNDIPLPPVGGDFTVNFGDQGRGIVGGVVFNDLDGNGQQSPYEAGIQGVTIQLIKGSQVVANASTDNQGMYRFTAVLPDVYTVIETDLPGYYSTTPNDVGIFVPPDGSATANFGDQQAGTVSGVVFDDLDGDGKQSSDEPGIRGVIIRLVNSVEITTTTDISGTYQFIDVRKGPYTVVETDPPGYFSVTPNSCSVSVSQGGSASCNFGDQRVGQVSGMVFNDLNGNGVRDDASETGVDGVLITLSDGSRRTTLTANGGLYTFVGVLPGAYTVIETDPEYCFSTTPNSHAVSVPSGGSASVSFGDQPAGIVSGVVFNDLNGNGVQEEGEGGIGGVIVELVNGHTNTTTTARNGTFIFVFVESRPYTVTVIETDPTGYVSTTPNSCPVSVPARGSASCSFGDQLAGTVSGTVFDDWNGNGVLDPNEGIGGVTVELINGATAMTTTVGNGSYIFRGIAAGAYAVRETDPDGYVSVTPNVVNVSVPPGGSATANFIDQPAGTIRGVVFHDLDGDGTPDAGEAGTGGVMVTVWRDETRVGTTSTSGDGTFMFAAMSSGTYRMCVESPPGFVSVTCRTVYLPPGGSVVVSIPLRLAASVSGTIFNDRNGNGRRDYSEPGLGGVRVELQQGGAVVTSAVTSGDGTYAFLSVAPGRYEVCAVAPDGFVATGALCRNIRLVAGGSAAVNFGFREVNSIQGVVFNDFNCNGRLDVGELGLGGVEVQLWGAEGLITTTTTSGDGGYGFATMAPGNYAVLELNPDGFISTSSDRVPVRLTAGGSAIANFGDERAGAVGGVVFDDLNGNRVQDAGEPGIGSVTITLSDSMTMTTTTVGNGAYLFTDVAAGTYTLSETDPEGYFSTTPNSVNVYIVIGGGGGASFGDHSIGEVVGTVFDDENGDSHRDPGERGLGGVTVELWQDSVVVTGTTTFSDGSYRFTHVVSGTYTVVETNPPGYFSTTPDQRIVYVATGGAATADFGDRLGGTVGGIVFNDSDGNSRQGPGELGIGGVTVALSDGSTRTTNADGTYEFSGVISGTYTVIETDPPGYVSTTPNHYIVSVPAGGSATANFGDRLVGTVSGVVFDDANGDGVQQIEQERGIGGVTVTLYNGSPITRTTAGDGSYQFTSVAPGAYAVVETDPPGYVSTTPNSRSVSVPIDGSAGASFGDQRIGTVGGTVFHDWDGDGEYDYPDENGFGRVHVQLINGIIRNAFTDGNGDYLFADVAPGNYTVCVIPPPGLVNTTPNCQPVLVADGGSASANFGFQWPGSISGVVFNDLNGNLAREPDEGGLGGAEVQLLLDVTNQVISTTRTFGNGSYSFSGLSMGRYTVVEIDPVGFTSSTPNTVIVGLEEGGAASADFGDFEAGTLSGEVFNDLNGNGRRDRGEDGIGGVTITLYDGSPITATTTGDGSFTFRNLISRTYTVVETDPPGFASSTLNEITLFVPIGGSSSVSFGDYTAGAIYGTKCYDRNGDGICTSGERGMGGVEITLYEFVICVRAPCRGPLVARVRTDAMGRYQFDNLIARTYCVEETVPEGFVNTSPNPVCVHLSPSSSSRVDFGNTRLGTVTGIVVALINPGAAYTLPSWAWVSEWSDVPLRDVTVELWNNERSVRIQTTMTATDGSYLFQEVTSGAYWVHLLRPPYGNSDWWHPVGWWPWDDPWTEVHVSAYGSATVNFHIQYDPCVVGAVYNDLNLDGVRGDGELGVGGVHLRLTTPGGATVRETDTAADGSYLFMAVDLGSYLVEVVPPNDWSSVTENPFAVALNDPAQGENVSFGLAASGASAALVRGGRQTGTIVNDTPLGALRGRALDPNHHGLPGVEITVRDEKGNPVGQATTIGNGTYQINGLPVGSLTVIESDSPGYTSLTPNTRTLYLSTEKGAAADFVDFLPGAGISGSVFRDDDGNGQRSPDEPGISGITVQLKQGGQVVQTYTTTVSGAYVFSLVDGVYEIAAANAEDHVSTTPDVVRGFGPAMINFGDRFIGTEAIATHTSRAVIAGRVYNDANANGVAEPGERPLGGVVVSLWTLTDTEVMTATTTGNGEYAFFDLIPDAYAVTVAPAPGFLATTPVSATAWAAADSTANVNFGRRYVATGHGAVAGRVFNDLDGNGRLNPAEPSLVGVGVRLVQPDGTPVAETTTAGDGSYLFDVAAGTYRLALVVPPGFAPTTERELALAVTEGQLSSVQFGLLAANTVSGAVFFDTDGDSVRSALEHGVGAITVTLRAADGGLAGQTVTSADGYYLFSDLSAGAYTASVILPAGLAATTPTSRPIALTAGHGATASFGVQIASTVGGVVFQDANGNDRLDEAETGISGARVSLAGSVVSRTITTTSSGSYQFLDLNAGIYTVSETDPAGFTSTRNAITVTVPAGGNAAADFGDRPVGTISGVVFHDLDGNKSMTDGEPGFGGVEVQLLATDTAAIIATATARGNGSYEFRDVPAGTYEVVVVIPSGFRATTTERVTVVLASGDSQAVSFGLRARAQHELYLPMVLRAGAQRGLYLPMVLRWQDRWQPNLRFLDR